MDRFCGICGALLTEEGLCVPCQGTRPLAQPQRDDGVLQMPELPEKIGWEDFPQDPRIADVFKRLDNPDSLGSTIRVAGHSEDV